MSEESLRSLHPDLNMDVKDLNQLKKNLFMNLMGVTSAHFKKTGLFARYLNDRQTDEVYAMDTQVSETPEGVMQGVMQEAPTQTSDDDGSIDQRIRKGAQAAYEFFAKQGQPKQ